MTRPAHRPAIAPRLATTEPADVAAEVDDLLRSHHSWSISQVWADTARLSAWLTGYAKDGTGSSVDARAFVEYVSRSLHASAANPRGEATAHGLPESIAIVLRAAGARASIALGSAVTASELAAVADITPQQVRLLARAGELSIKGGKITAAKAAEWLRKRGVAGV